MAYDTSDSADDTTDSDETERQQVPEKVAIEGDLPLTAIDIESQKDIMGKRAHPIRNFSKWFAARPTPAVRLAILGSAYPSDQLSSDKLLKLMQVGPKNLDSGIKDYVQHKYSQNKTTSGTLDDHYGYPNPNSQTPSDAQIEKIKSDLIDEWGGNLPTILDPTAGRGTIPFESIRYNFPAVSNEYDAVPFIINKIALDLAPEVGSVTEEYNQWANKIISRTKERTSEYFHTKEESSQILNYAVTYIITCDSCGGEVPLTAKWWLNKNASACHAVRPTYKNGEVSYNHIEAKDTSEFDPSNAPVARGGDTECPHCDVTTDSGRIREKFQEGSFEYSVYGVNYETQNGDWRYRAGDETDLKGLEKAQKRADSFELMDFFAKDILEGKKTSEPMNYGMTQWRDLFTPRQLVVNYELFEVISSISTEIYDAYDKKKANLLISLLAQAVDRQLGYNSRLSPWRGSKGGYVNEIFTSQNYSFKRMFGCNNITESRRGLKRQFEHVISNFESLTKYIDGTSTNAQIYNLDAANLSAQLESDSVDIAVVDPPYFDSIMYGELSDFMHLTQGELLDDVFPKVMGDVSNDKQMVVNNVRHEDPEEFYESSIRDMFKELSDILVDNGVVTLMFTDREAKAWNTILKTLIQSNFTITASHPIKTESSDKIGMRDKARVESSIFVTARNTPTDTNASEWNVVKDEMESIARGEAQRLLSVESVSKIDTSIEAFGAALEAYSDAYPVEDKYGETVYPGQVLTTVRNEVYSVIANDELSTTTKQLDDVTRWYVLSNVLYDDADIPFDEANQLGIGADIDIQSIKKPTKLWSKSSGDVSLNDHTDRVQDIVPLRDTNAENPSTVKYPVDPTVDGFSYTIDAVHAALHVYEREGQQVARNWLAERELKSNQEFCRAVKSLLEATPPNSQMRKTLRNIIAGETGEYLDINVTELNIGDDNGDRQSGMGEYE